MLKVYVRFSTPDIDENGSILYQSNAMIQSSTNQLCNNKLNKR